MTAKKGHLTIISTDSKVRNYLMCIISNIIGSEVEIAGYSSDEGIPLSLQTDLVLTSGEFMKDLAIEHFPNTPIIFSKRIITGHNLEHVIMTPQGQRALVVVHPKEASDDTIKSLREMGIEHLIFESYWKNKTVDISNIDLAITPGMLHICPPGIKRVIDIGERGISVETFAKILLYFNLDMHYLNMLEQVYSRQLVEASRKIHYALDASERLRGFQEAILQDIDEGILVIDDKERIVLHNHNTNQLFGHSGSLQENQSLRAILDSLKAEEETSGALSVLVKHRNKDLYCSKNSFVSGDKRHNIYTFKNVEQIQLLEQNVRRKMHSKGFVARHTFANLWGNNELMQKTKQLALRFAQTEQTILLAGESGTGKELFAQAIHNASSRANQPFVAVNLGAIPANLIESELFGYVEGAFTGAKKSGKMGVFELAHGGTIFLDEIGDAPNHIQVLLLRVLEERSVTRVGAEENTPVNIRIICATNKPLEYEVNKGNFRSDLFYRLNVLPIPTIPLRSMRSEIPDFIIRHLDASFTDTKQVQSAVLNNLKNYDWPGNFRELRNVVEYMYYSAGKNETIGLNDIPSYLFMNNTTNQELRDLVAKTPLLLPTLQLL